MRYEALPDPTATKDAPQPEAHILIDEDGPILRVTLNRPSKYNALDHEMWAGLGEATARFRDRDDLRVMLVTARGKYFCAGIDLNGALAPDPQIASPSAFRRWYRQGVGSLHPLGDEWEAIEKPIVVAHQGPCLGGALELSLCADFRFASTDARYGLPEIALGAIPGSGGTSRLTRLAGPHWARWLVLANRQIDAERALSIGLVHEVHPTDALAAAVDSFCAELVAIPPEAFAAGKLAIELTKDLERGQARNVERLTASSLILGEEFHSMMNAMKERLSRPKG
ncbi:acyl-CoA hydratase [Sphingobium sp. 22B]|uniref:enoyl-CoA hydratase/isomerase family protein n=1 Tax=unclassified Sphingobium TaxID=2611147 RepID=UPI000785E4C1|nr:MULTISPECIES: enoyl-CoA hydratase/isomerase family protein [unclassified Sphingobium]KXU33811.1 acyl-CoA hydratase [Sphingobium sp. AM]KYC33756.1 acyl-CoA hydratase [Sphingobium sp. 22B]OAP33494.1 acyl-CoA hydratase [Sphingobium sp. 20006FA]